MSEHSDVPPIHGMDAARARRWLLSDVSVRRIVGVLWLIDALLQLQPAMFTMNMVNGIMAPAAQGQPAPIASSLTWIIAFTTHNLTLVNIGIAAIQIAISLCLISGRWVKPAVVASVIWAAVVWYAGEGLSLMLTGQGSALTGAPGSVVLYALLGLTFLSQTDLLRADPRRPIRWMLGAAWCLAALLQLQPYWWKSGQISQTIGSMYSPGTLSGLLVDPSLHWAANVTSHIEVPLNLALVALFLVVGIGLFSTHTDRAHPWLIASIVLSLVVWWFGQDFGMMLTGMSTDPNSGPLLVLMALACWSHPYESARPLRSALAS